MFYKGALSTLPCGHPLVRAFSMFPIQIFLLKDKTLLCMYLGLRFFSRVYIMLDHSRWSKAPWMSREIANM